MLNPNDFDTVLYVVDEVNEDERTYTRGTPDPTLRSMYGGPVDTYLPQQYASNNYGRVLRQALSGMGSGFWAEVTDFGKWVVVNAGHHNYVTGKSSTKTFLIVFQRNGDGMILSTANKYRTISGADQAATYIKSSVTALTSDSARKI